MYRSRWIWWAILLVFLLAQGCSGCVDSFLDRIEEPLRSVPGRGGKVGTLRALEVGQSAREVARRMGLRAGGPCDLQWRSEDPFAVNFELQILVKAQQWERGWQEKGSFQQDQQGWWQIKGLATFYDEVQPLERERRFGVFADAEGFWEILGPGIMAQHRAGEQVHDRWRQEFLSRFSGLMELVGPGWSEAGFKRWVPGDEIFVCGPGSQQESSAWRAILNARGERREAEIRQELRGDERCRQLRASYQLRGGATMQISYSECLGDAPEQLERPADFDVVEVGREEHLVGLLKRVENWIEVGIVEPAEP